MKAINTGISLFKGVYKLVARYGFLALFAKVMRVLSREDLRGILRVIRKTSRDYYYSSYPNWFKDYGTLKDNDRVLIKKHIAGFLHSPLISVLMPTYNTPEAWLRRAIDSVRMQLYPHWELCIADDASTETHVRAVLDEYGRLDGRIHVVYRKENGHISAATNSALELATGAFFALLDHDDELAEHALYLVAHALEQQPFLDLLYSDEDKVDDAGRHFDPYFKSDWNPDLFMAQNIVSHLGVYRTALAREVGGFRQGFEGSQDWDLALRVSERIPASHIKHLPYVLYHWHAVAGSTAVDVEEKPYAVGGGMAAVRAHIVRTGRVALVSQAVSLYLRVRHALPDPSPLVSIIIPTRNGLNLLCRCIDSIRVKTTYAPFEILVVDNQSDDPETLRYLRSLQETGAARVLTYNAPFNYSAINNYAAHAAHGRLLCLLNNDVEVINSDWLDEMVSQAMRPEIGSVGAMLYYPDGTIQHAGVIVGLSGCADHVYAEMPQGTTGMMGRACLVQNLSAVTAACMVVRKDVFDEVDGFDELHLPVSFNDVDFCLKVQERGYRNLWTPYAELYHHESASRGSEDTPEKWQRFKNEIAYMHSRWQHLINNDPAYNPNLTLDYRWPYPAETPRVKKPWQTH